MKQEARLNIKKTEKKKTCISLKCVLCLDMSITESWSN